MEAGRELDALIAEDVMGIVGVGQTIGDVYDTDWYDSEGLPIPHYSTDIAAAWRVVEALQAKGLICVVTTPSPGYTNWDVRGWNPETNDNRYIAHAPTAPHAICIAALKVKENSNAS